MIVLVFVLVLYFCAVLCACYVDFAPAIHNIPIVFYYFIENVHSCRHMLVSHVYIYIVYATYLCMAIVLFVACILVLRVLCIVSPSYDDYYYYIVNAYTTPTIHNYFSPKYTRVLFAKTKHYCVVYIYCSVSFYYCLYTIYT